MHASFVSQAVVFLWCCRVFLQGHAACWRASFRLLSHLLALSELGLHGIIFSYQQHDITHVSSSVYLRDLAVTPLWERLVACSAEQKEKATFMEEVHGWNLLKIGWTWPFPTVTASVNRDYVSICRGKWNAAIHFFTFCHYKPHTSMYFIVIQFDKRTKSSP